MNINDRRLELLKMEGIGASPNDIVKELAGKYHVSERQIYYDFESRSVWQPKLLQLKDPDRIMQKIVNRYEFLYRKASFMFLTINHPNVQFAYMKLMFEINKEMRETLLPTNRKVELTQNEPFIIKMWRPEDATVTTKE